MKASRDYYNDQDKFNILLKNEHQSSIKSSLNAGSGNSAPKKDYTKPSQNITSEAVKGMKKFGINSF